MGHFALICVGVHVTAISSKVLQVLGWNFQGAFLDDRATALCKHKVSTYEGQSQRDVKVESR